MYRLQAALVLVSVFGVCSRIACVLFIDLRLRACCSAVSVGWLHL